MVRVALSCIPCVRAARKTSLRTLSTAACARNNGPGTPGSGPSVSMVRSVCRPSVSIVSMSAPSVGGGTASSGSPFWSAFWSAGQSSRMCSVSFIAISLMTTLKVIASLRTHGLSRSRANGSPKTPLSGSSKSGPSTRHAASPLGGGCHAMRLEPPHGTYTPLGCSLTKKPTSTIAP